MKYLKNNIIREIAFAGLLMALALSLSFIPPIHVFGGAIYFVGIVTLAMPLLLRINFALVTGIASVVIADLISG